MSLVFSARPVWALYLCCLFMLPLNNCAGQSPNPILTQQAGDKLLDCEDIEIEQMSIADEVAALYGEKSSKRKRNVGIGVAGAILFWPALLAMDFSDAQMVEIQALQRRERHLNSLARRKDC